MLLTLKSKHVAKFIYKDLICQHECFGRMISDSSKKNKKKVKKLLIKYLIKHVVILAYNPQANEMIEREHQPIIDVLFKLTNEFIKHGQDD